MWCPYCRYGSERARLSDRCPMCGSKGPWLNERPFKEKNGRTLRAVNKHQKGSEDDLGSGE